MLHIIRVKIRHIFWTKKIKWQYLIIYSRSEKYRTPGIYNVKDSRVLIQWKRCDGIIMLNKNNIYIYHKLRSIGEVSSKNCIPKQVTGNAVVLLKIIVKIESKKNKAWEILVADILVILVFFVRRRKNYLWCY